jgi:hypothetical protein
MMSRVSLLVFALFIGSEEAAACRCDRGSPQAAAARSRQVYLGRVVSLSDSRGQGLDALRTAQLLVTLPVKGVTLADTVSVTFPDNSCGPGFAVGKEYLVYTVGDTATGELYTSYCAGTKPVHCAADDLHALAVSVPEHATSCEPRRPTGSDRDPPPGVSPQLTGGRN